MDFFDNRILIKDYAENIYYFADLNGNPVSDYYRDIFVMDNGYIVKNLQEKYIIIDKEFKRVHENIEYDYISPVLLDKGLYICGRFPIKINFNNFGYPQNIEYDLVDLNGNVITLKDLEGNEIPNPAYTTVYYLNNRKNVSAYETYIEILTDIKYTFVGEDYYINFYK